MKANIVTSAVVHGLILVWALVSITAPKSFEVQPDESTPVEIVTDVSMTQQGDKKAPQKDKASLKPTTKQTQVANAQNAGENDVDLKTAPKPVPKPTENQSTGAPKKVDAPTPKVDPTPNDVKSVEKEETDTPPPPPPKEAAEVPKPPTPTPPPVPTPTPPPVPTPTPTPTPPPPTPAPTQDKAELAPSDQPTPENVPTPQLKPQPPTPPTPPKVVEKPVEKPPEKKPDVKPAEKPADKKTPQTADKSSETDKKKDDKKREVAKAASSKDSDFNADEISALLNKQQATGGGAKRQQQQAALGTDKPSSGAKLSQSEIDALRSQIQNNWNVPAGMSGVAGMVIRVHMKLDESGTIIGEPDVQVTGGSASSQQALSGSATRAVMMSSPFKNLPRDKYDAWNEVIVNFDPSDLGL